MAGSSFIYRPDKDTDARAVLYDYLTRGLIIGRHLPVSKVIQYGPNSWVKFSVYRSARAHEPSMLVVSNENMSRVFMTVMFHDDLDGPVPVRFDMRTLSVPHWPKAMKQAGEMTRRAQEHKYPDKTAWLLMKSPRPSDYEIQN